LQDQIRGPDLQSLKGVSPYFRSLRNPRSSPSQMSQSDGERFSKGILAVKRKPQQVQEKFF
jgi:hypothetical protein